MTAEPTLRRLDADDIDAYLLLREASFGYPEGDEVRETLRQRLAVTWGAFVDGALAASLADPSFELFVAGRVVPMVGIAAVQSAPEHRRTGLAARLMRRALEAGRAAGVGWSALYPFDPRFYARYGWQGLPTGARLEFPLASLPSLPVPATVERLTGGLRAGLQELRLRCMRSWSFANARTEGPWDVWEDLAPSPGKRRLVYRMTQAYAVVDQGWDDARPGTRLDVVDAAACGRAGREELLGLLGTFRGQANVVVLDLPSDDPLTWDWSGWHALRKRPTYMVRPVDVVHAIGSLRAVLVGADDADDVPIGVPPFAVRIVDGFAPWNEGCFEVTPGTDGCAVEAAGHADCTLDVRGLTLLASGAAGPTAVVRAGLAEGARAPLAALATLSGGVTPYNAPDDAF